MAGDAPVAPAPSATRVGPVPRGTGVPAAPDRPRSPARRVVRAAGGRRRALARRDRAGGRRVRARRPWGARRGARRARHRPGARGARRGRHPALGAGLPGGAVRLAADDGPALRYRSFLAALRGHADVVVGTRASAFAPVHDLGLAVVWDDGDPLHAEPRAPYPHVREVLALRSELESCALLVAGHGRSVEAQALVESGWAREVVADRATTRARAPRVQALTSVELAREGPAAAARLPAPAWRTVRDRLADGPVLVQVPRAGYLPAVACGRCRAAARCGVCHGPLGLARRRRCPPAGWCGRLATDWRCTECGSATLRSVRVGSERTAEELGRAFPGVPVRVSGARAAGGVLATVPDVPAVVVSTPGAEPVAPGGYAAALLLDASVSTAGAALRTGEDALRRWLTAAALVRPASEGGVVLLVGDAEERATQALVRWDPAGYASRELAERAELALPPAVRIASVTGPRDAVDTLVVALDVPELEVLGPVPVETRTDALEHEVRALVRVPRAPGRRARPGAGGVAGRPQRAPRGRHRPGPARPGGPGMRSTRSSSTSDRCSCAGTRSARSSAGWTGRPSRRSSPTSTSRPSTTTRTRVARGHRRKADVRARFPQHSAALDLYVDHFADALPGPVPGSEQLVRDLRGAGVRTLGLTNWSAETFHLAEPAAPAIGLLEDVLVSGPVGLAKPDERIFRAADRPVRPRPCVDALHRRLRRPTSPRRRGRPAGRAVHHGGRPARAAGRARGAAAPHLGSRPCDCSSPEPPRPRCRRSRPLLASRHEVVAVLTRPDARSGRGRTSGAERREGARARGWARGAHPGPAARRRVPGAADRAGGRRGPRRGLRRPDPAGAARRAGARLGQPALLGPARVAGRGARAARAHRGRRGHRRLHVPARGGPGHRPGVRVPHRDDPRRATPRATCSAGSPWRARGCWCRRSTRSRTASSARSSRARTA